LFVGVTAFINFLHTSAVIMTLRHNWNFHALANALLCCQYHRARQKPVSAI